MSESQKATIITFLTIIFGVIVAWWIFSTIKRRIKNEKDKAVALTTMPSPTQEDYVNAAKIHAALPTGWFSWQNEDDAVKIVRLYVPATYKALYRAFYEKYDKDLTKFLYDELSSSRYKSIAHIVTI